MIDVINITTAFVYAVLCTLVFISPILIPEYIRRKSEKNMKFSVVKYNTGKSKDEEYIIDVCAKEVRYNQNSITSNHVGFGFGTGLF